MVIGPGPPFTGSDRMQVLGCRRQDLTMEHGHDSRRNGHKRMAESPEQI